MISYILFIGMVLIPIVLFLVCDTRPKETTYSEKYKCESPIERMMYEALAARGEYVRTQVPCGRYSIDIALPTYHLAIECDGKAYHSTPKQKAHDKRKDKYLRANGWTVLRFTGSRIHRDMKGILKRIDKVKGGRSYV
jgi:very-short-patch-repair endonuclease